MFYLMNITIVCTCAFTLAYVKTVYHIKHHTDQILNSKSAYYRDQEQACGLAGERLAYNQQFSMVHVGYTALIPNPTIPKVDFHLSE